MQSTKLRKKGLNKATKKVSIKGSKKSSKNRRRSYFAKTQSQQEIVQQNELISRLGACAKCDSYVAEKPHYNTSEGIKIFCLKVAEHLLAKTQFSSFENCDPRPIKILAD